jgi:uncharacterized membrane protein YdfJ with MMPL/SSD domain
VAGLLHRIGAFCADHRYIVLALWLAIALGAVLAVRQIGALTSNNITLPGTDSQAAVDLLSERFPPQQNGTSPLVFHVSSGKLTDTNKKKAITAAYEAVKEVPHVHSAVNPFSQQGQGFLSKDEKTAFIPVLLDIGSGDLTVPMAQAVLDAGRPAEKAGIQTAVGGPVGSKLSQPDTERSELIGLAAAMAIIALTFGSLVAMGMPILSALIGLAVGFSLVGLAGHVVSIPDVGVTLAIMIGLGVGIDYALFLLSRFRDELNKGQDVREAVATSVATAAPPPPGSAVVFAGATVIIALCSLAVAGIPLVTYLGFAAAIVVFTAVLAATTLLPAVLAIAGRQVFALGPPGFLRRAPRTGRAGVWGTWARGVTRRPWVALVVATAILAPLIVPVFNLRLGQEDIGETPSSTTERQAFDLLSAGFGPGYNGPLLIATELDPVAGPSEEYTKKYDEATALQKTIEQQQKQLQQQADRLEEEQSELEDEQRVLLLEQASLQTEGAQLRGQETVLRAEESQLRAQAADLRRQAEALAKQARPLVRRLAALRAEQAVVERELEQATDPAAVAALQQRLDLIAEQQQAARAQLTPLLREARPLVREARRLEGEAAGLARQAAALRAEATSLQAQAAALRSQAAALRTQGAELQAEASQLQRQKQQVEDEADQAKRLKAELTQMLTKAGGDDRGTDPRLIKLQNSLGGPDAVLLVSPPDINKSGDAAIFSVIPVSRPAALKTAALVHALRSTVIPAATGEGGIAVHVGGSTAANVDLAALISDRLWIVIATVLGLSSVLLVVAFRSLLVPVQAAITNMLCVGAAFGVLTATFQYGWGLGAIGLAGPTGSVPIASYVPLMMFAVLFGLAMDYEVFLISRISQNHAAGMSPREAVRAGLASSARVIAAAGLIMIAVFGSFILNGDPTVKQFGVGLSAAVLLAASMTLLLAPAILVYFGRALWWLPDWLRRLVPDLHLDDEAPPPPPAGKSKARTAPATHTPARSRSAAAVEAVPVAGHSEAAAPGAGVETLTPPAASSEGEHLDTETLKPDDGRPQFRPDVCPQGSSGKNAA